MGKTQAKDARQRRKAKDLLEEWGYWHMTSAGSRGLWDIHAKCENECIMIGCDEARCYLYIQLKSNTKPPPSEMRKMRAWQKKHPDVHCEVWIFHDGKPRDPEIIEV